jgi:LysM repeat protein
LAEVGTPEAEAGRTEEAVLIRPVTPVHRRVTPAGPTVSGNRHLVKAGETLWRIAQNNGISVDALMQANPGVSASSLKIGRELIIPPKPSTTD